jgi:hypothetical protein
MNGLTGNLQEYLAASSLLAYPAAFVAGMLISFTPCVYPIIPIQLGFIGGQTAMRDVGQKVRLSLRGFALSVLFVVGMAVVYAALGAFASLTGTLFGIWAASRWTYIVVSNVILVLALSMLDVFQLPTPQFLTNWKSGTQRQRLSICALDRGGFGSRGWPLHCSSAGRSARLCRHKGQRLLRYVRTFRVCPGDGCAHDRPGNIQRRIGGNAALWAMDGQSEESLRLDHDRCCGIFAVASGTKIHLSKTNALFFKFDFHLRRIERCQDSKRLTRRLRQVARRNC